MDAKPDSPADQIAAGVVLTLVALVAVLFFYAPTFERVCSGRAH